MMKLSLSSGYVLWVTVSFKKKYHMITDSFGHLISHEVSMIFLLRISKAKYSSSKECKASYSELATSSSLCNHQLHYCHHLNKLFLKTNI